MNKIQGKKSPLEWRWFLYCLPAYSWAPWLRNNGSTLTSQMVDSVAVILITYFFTSAISITPGETVAHGLLILVLSNYFFKMIAALVDTLPFYLGTRFLSRYLEIDPNETLK